MQPSPGHLEVKPDPNEAHLPQLPEDRDVRAGGRASDQPDPHRRTNLRELPYWYSQVWGLLDEEGTS